MSAIDAYLIERDVQGHPASLRSRVSVFWKAGVRDTIPTALEVVRLWIIVPGQLIQHRSLPAGYLAEVGRPRQNVRADRRGDEEEYHDHKRAGDGFEGAEMHRWSRTTLCARLFDSGAESSKMQRVSRETGWPIRLEA